MHILFVIVLFLNGLFILALWLDELNSTKLPANYFEGSRINFNGFNGRWIISVIKIIHLLNKNLKDSYTKVLFESKEIAMVCDKQKLSYTFTF